MQPIGEAWRRLPGLHWGIPTAPRPATTGYAEEGRGQPLSVDDTTAELRPQIRGGFSRYTRVAETSVLGEGDVTC